MTRHGRREDDEQDDVEFDELTDNLGRYAVLYRFVTRVITPVLATLFVICFLPWCIWVTRGVFRVDAIADKVVEHTASIEDMQRNNRATFDAIRDRFESLPPADWRVRIERLEEFDRANTADRTAIKLMLESIRVKLGITPADGPQ